eukprot:5054716-Amphidinium_carterae.2
MQSVGLASLRYQASSLAGTGYRTSNFLQRRGKQQGAMVLSFLSVLVVTGAAQVSLRWYEIRRFGGSSCVSLSSSYRILPRENDIVARA